MEYFDYSNAPYPIRDDIASACRDYWAKLASPGTWWSGAERIAIAQESRNALNCSFCKVRKEALSPYALEGEHDHSGGLPLLAVDAVHRVITDQTCITQAYVDKNAESGLSKEAYVELVGVVVAVFSIDEFHRSLGLPEESLPVAREGEPTRYRPANLSEDMGFVPSVPPDGAIGEEADSADKGIEFGTELMHFAESVARRDGDALASSRRALLDAAGPEVLVDAAGVAANFQRMVRIADSTGIPYDDVKSGLGQEVRDELNLADFATAQHSFAPARED